MYTTITDEAIDDLSKLKNLQKLRIAYTDISEEGAAKLQGLLPMVEVDWIAKRKDGVNCFNRTGTSQPQWDATSSPSDGGNVRCWHQIGDSELTCWRMDSTISRLSSLSVSC